MKKLLFCVISLALVTNLFSATKKTGWEQNGLKGKVKECIKIDYAVKNKSGNDVKEAAGKTICLYDDRGRLIEQTEYNATGALTDKSIYKYRYDDNGNPVECVFYNADEILTGKSIFNPKICIRNRKIRERGVKNVEALKGYKVEPETTEPGFERVPSRSMLIMAHLGEWNECLLSARFNVSTLPPFHPSTLPPFHPSTFRSAPRPSTPRLLDSSTLDSPSAF